MYSGSQGEHRDGEDGQGPRLPAFAGTSFAGVMLRWERRAFILHSVRAARGRPPPFTLRTSHIKPPPSPINSNFKLLTSNFPPSPVPAGPDHDDALGVAGEL